jgi:hypothetical protein
MSCSSISIEGLMLVTFVLISIVVLVGSDKICWGRIGRFKHSMCPYIGEMSAVVSHLPHGIPAQRI